MPATTLRLGAAVLAAALGFAACGEDEPEAMPATQEEYVDAVVAIDEAAVSDDEEMTRCVWTSIIDAISFDRIVAADVTPSDLIGTTLSDNDLDIDDDAAAELTAAVSGCGDFVDMMLADVDEDVAECFSARVSNDLIAEALVEGFRGNDPPAEFEAAAEECSPD